MKHFVLGIDQSTQGTKALLFDSRGNVSYRAYRPHHQYVDDKGWVEHDAEEIYQNVVALVKELLQENHLTGKEILAVGISNQRETAMAWNRVTGKPIGHAIVWQCARGASICEALAKNQGFPEKVKAHTGLPLSPYFSAAKLAWILQNVPEAAEAMAAGRLCMGTMDSWLVYRLTEGAFFRTDASNASRTELFSLQALTWDKEICAAFGILPDALPEICDSDAWYGDTDFSGVLPGKIPIHAVFGDSHAALYGQGCHAPGMMKATYGTGSSVMMNIGDHFLQSRQGLVTSLAWKIQGCVHYVLEGNINYTGASIRWLEEDVHLIADAAATESLAKMANPADQTYFVPAFTGLGAPYWDSSATGLFTGITRVTGQKELVRAVVDSIAYQIGDIVQIMKEESGQEIRSLRVDGGPTKNCYLMQLQTDLLGIPVEIPEIAELSAMGAAYAAGIGIGFYAYEKLFTQNSRKQYSCQMTGERRQRFWTGWHAAVQRALMKV